MDPEKKEVPAPAAPAVDDEAALDAQIQADIAEVKAGKELVASKSEAPVKPEENVQGATGATGATGAIPAVEDPSKPQVAKEEGEFELRIPNKGKFESDEAYELRIQLFDQVKRRKAATTPEAKAALSAEISQTKVQLKNLNGPDKSINNLNKVVEEPKVTEEDPALVADRERLKQLGGVTKDDVLEMARQERLALDIKNTLESFVEKSPELKDPDMREVFFDFVDANYNWQGKSGKELRTILELAKENVFKPSETIQDRVLKGANVAEKINAMQFPGSTGAKVDISAERRKDIEELKATGMSEEKAMELTE